MTDKNADYQPSPQLRQTIREWLDVNSEGLKRIDCFECVEVLTELIPELNFYEVYEHFGAVLNDMGYRTEQGGLWTAAGVSAVLPVALHEYYTRRPEGVSTWDECENTCCGDTKSLIEVVAGKVHVRLPRDTSMDELATLVTLLGIVVD